MIYPLLQSADAQIGVCFHEHDGWQCSVTGTTVYFDSEGPRIERVDLDSLPNKTCLSDIDVEDYDYTGYDCDSERSVVRRSGGYLPMRRKVYNLEVANTHTYYVGEQGLWVHNTSGIDVSKIPGTPTKAIDVFQVIRLKQISKKSLKRTAA